MSVDRRLFGWPVVVVSVLAGMMASGAMVWRASEAAFSGITTNPTNSWTAGSVALGDDDGGVDHLTGTAMFTATGLTPATPTQQKCIVVTNTGNITPATPVKLYGAALSGTGLGTYITLTIQLGTNSAATFNNTCAGFVQSSVVFGPATLASFATAHTGWANGLTTGWTPTAGQSRSFRFSYAVVDNPLANGLTCGMPFTWEAQG